MSYLESCQYSDRLIKKLKQLDLKGQLDFALIEKAIIWAKKYHDGQFRKTGEPYYTHPLEVAYMVADYLLNTDIIITSILHDTIEDTELTSELISKTFGDRICRQVEDLTRVKNGYKISSAELINSLWQQKKYDLLIVKLFDRLHNMQTISAKSPEKIRKIVDETLNSFLILAVHSQNKDLEENLFHLCCKALSKNSEYYELSQSTDKKSYLASLEKTDIDQFVFQVFQSAITQIESNK